MRGSNIRPPWAASLGAAASANLHVLLQVQHQGCAAGHAQCHAGFTGPHLPQGEGGVSLRDGCTVVRVRYVITAFAFVQVKCKCEHNGGAPIVKYHVYARADDEVSTPQEMPIPFGWASSAAGRYEWRTHLFERAARPRCRLWLGYGVRCASAAFALHGA